MFFKRQSFLRGRPRCFQVRARNRWEHRVGSERSALDPAAQPYQDLIDQLCYGMAGLASDEVKGLEERYARML
jgi:hypothetical protein